MAGECRVLLLEDHEASRLAMNLLFRRAGLTVCVAETVAEAFGKMDGQDVAVLDMNLPDGSGLDVLARIRADGRPMRVAMLTAVTDARELALQSGANAFFAKPLTSERLNSLVEWIAVGASSKLRSYERLI